MPLMPLRDRDPYRIGRYRLVARLGAGGMGVVYLGDAGNGGQVAIKVLRPELSDDADFRARFRREVAALGRVSGICTVRVIEADVDAAQPYLVTEYAAGPTLAEWAAEEGPFGPEMLASLAAGLAEALAAIHAAGVVHRDLKPGNVLLTADGPKVIDFGIAQTLDATSVTRTGMSVGSPGFMAPEQVRGKPGPATDIFAWGLTVAYAASGQPPFGTGPADVIIYRILHDDPDIEAVPESLKPLVSAALAKKPEDRPTARDLLSALAAGPDAAPVVVAADAALQAMLSRTWAVPARRPPEATVLRRPRRRSLTSRHPFLLPAAGAALVLTCAGVAFGVSSLQQTSQPATATLDPTTGTCVMGTIFVPCPSPSAGQCGVAPSLYICPLTASSSYSAPPPAGQPYTPEPTQPFIMSTITPHPYGPCQATCPSFVATPNVEISGDYSADSLWLEQNGWQTLNTGPGWGYGLNVIIARKFGATSGGIRAFFFNQNYYTGNDVPDGDGSTSLEALRLAPDLIVIRYHLESATASVADVRFHLDNNKLIRLDPIPPAQYRRW
jgi:serine/threonine protein kinase